MNEQYNEQTSISLNRLLVMFLHGLKKLWLLVLVLTVLGAPQWAHGRGIATHRATPPP